MLDISDIRLRKDKARWVVTRMCSGDGKWLMCIPANPKTDSDILISESLNDIEPLIEKIEQLYTERDFFMASGNAFKEEVEELKKDDTK